MDVLKPNGFAAAMEQFLLREQLPDHYREDVETFYRPLAGEITRLSGDRDDTLVLGIQGAQGTGKSTLAMLLALLLREEHGLSVAHLSIDDFYLDHAARRRLAADVHPLLATRGVPGTHDVKLALATLQALEQADASSEVALPRFDKANDDRLGTGYWERITGPIDVVVLEGWCLGAPPQTEAELNVAVNRLERELDADGRWRHYVNGQLAGPYRHWFARIDYLVVLQAPSFDSVYAWRGLQEQKLAAASGGSSIMSVAELEEFIAHYERLTCHCLRHLPALADRVYQLDERHRLIGASGSSS